MKREKRFVVAGAAGLCLAAGLFSGTPVGAARRKASGDEVFAANCASCHAERFPAERTDAEWDVIIRHMRVRAGLTAEEEAAVLEYLHGSN